MSKAKAIRSEVTQTVAKEWEADPEQTCFFDDLMGACDIDVSLTNRPNEFDRMQKVFEDRCEVVLKNSRMGEHGPAAACKQCGGWTSFGGMSQHSEGLGGCNCKRKKKSE